MIDFKDGRTVIVIKYISPNVANKITSFPTFFLKFSFIRAVVWNTGWVRDVPPAPPK